MSRGPRPASTLPFSQQSFLQALYPGARSFGPLYQTLIVFNTFSQYATLATTRSICGLSGACKRTWNGHQRQGSQRRYHARIDGGGWYSSRLLFKVRTSVRHHNTID